MFTVQKIEDALNLKVDNKISEKIYNMIKEKLSYIAEEVEMELEDVDMEEFDMGKIVIMEITDDLKSLPIPEFLNRDLTSLVPEFVEKFTVDKDEVWYDILVLCNNEYAVTILLQKPTEPDKVVWLDNESE